MSISSLYKNKKTAERAARSPKKHTLASIVDQLMHVLRKVNTIMQSNGIMPKIKASPALVKPSKPHPNSGKFFMSKDLTKKKRQVANHLYGLLLTSKLKKNLSSMGHAQMRSLCDKATTQYLAEQNVSVSGLIPGRRVKEPRLVNTWICSILKGLLQLGK